MEEEVFESEILASPTLASLALKAVAPGPLEGFADHRLSNWSRLIRTGSLASKCGYRKMAARDARTKIIQSRTRSEGVRLRESALRRFHGEMSDHLAQSSPGLERPHWLAGAPGFEPGNGGIKIRCLTTWLRPK